MLHGFNCTDSARIFGISLTMFNRRGCVNKFNVLYLSRYQGERHTKRHNGDMKPRRKQEAHISLYRRSLMLCEASFFYYMYHKRNIYIDPKLAKAAVGSKESIEALAVVLAIKVSFVSSLVKDASAVRLMHILRIGHTRYKRAVNYALRNGWLVREGDNIRAASIKTLDSYNVRLVFTKHYYNGRRSDDVRCPYTLTQLCNFIRQAVLLYHISKQAVVYDTITTATRQLTSSKARSKQSAAMKRVEGWGMRKPKLRKKADRLSYARMSDLAGCSKSKAKSLVKSLIGGGVINKSENYEKTKWHIDEYSKILRDNYVALGNRGFLVRHDGKVMLRLANSYSLNKPIVKYVANGSKTA